uniref:Uncharacterized protein n=1 Tax=Myoviridae sp. ctj3P51 TaxID=2826687 RepID=A0A8S5NNY2_9CAUD|nr:MAG TPA: hypothetical protein [Myoviridae sp. ctj3P51]
MQNYIVLNGKKILLNNEQAKALTKQFNPPTFNPCKRQSLDETYYYINDGLVEEGTDDYSLMDLNLYQQGNYFTDRDFAEHVALGHELHLLLLQYAYNHGYIDNYPWNGENFHYYIGYREDENIVSIQYNAYTEQPNTVYFKSEEDARYAIDDVVKPFMRDHPNYSFLWKDKEKLE